MNTTYLWRAVVAIGAVGGAGGGAVMGQSIVVVEPAAGYQYSEARYVAPGGTVVGTSYNSGLYSPRPTRWASAGAVGELLGVPGPTGGGEAYRCSDDGQVVVGRWMADVNSSIPAMWGASGGFTALPTPPDIIGEANGVSADGSVVTGWAAGTGGRWLQRWENGAVVQSYSPFGGGPCSADGSTVVGLIYQGGSSVSIGRWTTAGGPNGSAQNLGQFPASITGVRPPTAVTAGSDAAVGTYTLAGGMTRAWRWQNGQITDMGMPLWANSLVPRGISGDGSLVVGSALVMVQPSVFRSEAKVWTGAAGWQGFADWLSGRGVSFPGWTFSQLYYVSPDGMTFAGAGVSPTGYRGFVVTVPSPGVLGVVALVGVVAGARRRRG